VAGVSDAFRTTVVDDVVVVRYPDPAGAVASVRLWSELDLADPPLTRVDEGWELRVTDLPVDRLEYLLDVDGGHRLDPTNPQTVSGAFGEHSWVGLPSYAPPTWLAAPQVPSEQAGVVIEDTAAGPPPSLRASARRLPPASKRRRAWRNRVSGR